MFKHLAHLANQYSSILSEPLLGVGDRSDDLILEEDGITAVFKPEEEAAS
jgi:hypothetical protein